MERTEVAEIEALRANFAAVPTSLAEDFGIASRDLGGGALAVRVSSAPDNAFINHALGISTVEQLDALPELYGDCRHAVSSAPGIDLDAALRERGYEPGYAWMKSSRDAEPPDPVPTDLVVAEVGRDHSADFAHAAVAGFELPLRVGEWLAQLPDRGGWHCFVAYDGEEPAAAGALYVQGDAGTSRSERAGGLGPAALRGNVGWLGIAATRPEFRRGARRARSSPPGSAALRSSAARSSSQRPVRWSTTVRRLRTTTSSALASRRSTSGRTTFRRSPSRRERAR